MTLSPERLSRLAVAGFHRLPYRADRERTAQVHLKSIVYRLQSGKLCRMSAVNLMSKPARPTRAIRPSICSSLGGKYRLTVLSSPLYPLAARALRARPLGRHGATWICRGLCRPSRGLCLHSLPEGQVDAMADDKDCGDSVTDIQRILKVIGLVDTINFSTD